MSSYNGKIDISMEFDSPEYDEDGDPIANEIDRELPSEERIKEFFGDL